MIVSRTPFRASFVGGGTDLRDFYATHGFGAVVSMALRKYMYLVIHPYFQDKIRIKYSRTEDVASPDDVAHPLVRQCLKRAGVSLGVEIASFADVASGTGLGSSSSFAVGLLRALYAYAGQDASAERLAREACAIEIEELGEPIGKQDQYAAAFGGLNRIRFHADERVEVLPIRMDPAARTALEQSLRLYYVGGSRRSRDILGRQRENLREHSAVFDAQVRMLEMVDELAERLEAGDVAAAGEIMHQGWLVKRELAGGISTPDIDDLYERARRAGATGGKLLGAGGAGFLLLQHEDHGRLAQVLGLRTLEARIDDQGSSLLLSEPNGLQSR